MAPDTPAPRLKIDEPRYDQSTYWGRARHFFVTTNPLNMMKSGEDLDKAKDIVTRYRKGEDIPGLSEDDIWDAKATYDSAFHPDTGEKMISIGRMSAQVPMNMSITGCMLTFYKSRKEVIFWQWVNQTFNAVVNFSNRSGDSPISETQLATSYVLATGGALATALTLNNLVKSAPPLIGRFVPFAAVAAANCVNIPMMRMKELTDGITITDENGNRVGESKKAAKVGIASVVFSRILMASPGMIFPPIIMDRLERGQFLKNYKWMSGPIQVLLCGFCLTFATPMCCALFPQKSSIAVSSLEPELQERIKKLPNAPTVVYYNKGL